MSEPKKDPRMVRTRKYIMDAFIELSAQKEFKDITIKDLTTKAQINRATFYYHFSDIYDLLEKVLVEVLQINLEAEVYENDKLTEESLVRIFKAITTFQESLSYRCYRGYEETIGRIIKDQLEILFYKMLTKQQTPMDERALKLAAVMLSWGIYGASVEWRRNDLEKSPEEFIQAVIPYILHGTERSF